MIKDNIFWTADPSIIKISFSDFINDYYPNFKFKYNWSILPEIEDYLIRLMYNSFSNSNNVKSQLPELIHDVEMFFASGLLSGIFNDSNLLNILQELKDKNNGFQIIEFLPKELSGVFGNSIENKIQINQNMTRHPNSPNLTPQEIRRMYMFHEMGHKILNILSNEKTINDFTDTIDDILQSKGLTNVDLNYKYFVKEGFWMIEECLAQELAEYLTYYSSNKKRPNFESRVDLGCQISSNLDYYGIFQMPTINLGKTIRGCSNEKSTSEEILLNMIKKALNSNFDIELIYEYNQGSAELYYDLFLTLRTMGFIKYQKYASFGFGIPLKINVQSCLDAIEKITKKNRDYLTEEFSEINFKHNKTA